MRQSEDTPSQSSGGPRDCQLVRCTQQWCRKAEGRWQMALAKQLRVGRHLLHSPLTSLATYASVLSACFDVQRLAALHHVNVST